MQVLHQISIFDQSMSKIDQKKSNCGKDPTDMRTLLKVWSCGCVAAADLKMPDVAMELYNGANVQRGFANTADAFNKDIEPPTLVFDGK